MTDNYDVKGLGFSRPAVILSVMAFQCSIKLPLVGMGVKISTLKMFLLREEEICI